MSGWFWKELPIANYPICIMLSSAERTAVKIALTCVILSCTILNVQMELIFCKIAYVYSVHDVYIGGLDSLFWQTITIISRYGIFLYIPGWAQNGRGSACALARKELRWAWTWRERGRKGGGALALAAGVNEKKTRAMMILPPATNDPKTPLLSLFEHAATPWTVCSTQL